MQDNEVANWKRRFERERTTKKEAERLLEEKSLELYNVNKSLKTSIRELNRNKIFIDKIFDNSALGIITTDVDGIITLFNKRAEEMLGYKSEEIIGKMTPQLFHKEEEIKKRKEKFEQKYSINLKSDFEVFVAKTNVGVENADEWIYVDKNGEEFNVVLHITSLIDEDSKKIGYLGLVEDITDKKKKEKQIRDYMQVINQNVITSSSDLKGFITNVSSAFCQITGYSKEELIGLSHSVLRHPSMPDLVYENLWNSIKDDKVWKGEIKNRKKDGSFFWVEMSISPDFDEHGKKIGYTTVQHDITDKKRIEEISIRDGLTNLYNRRHFNEKFPDIFNYSKRNHSLVSFLILDIDNFKKYNDTYGHQEGDKVLKKVADTIQGLLKREDDYCFRLGGEEFGVIFKIENKEKGKRFAEEIRKSIENLKIEHKKNTASPYVTVSLGLFCEKPTNVKNTDEIYKNADDLLYCAKSTGRNKMCSTCTKT